MTNDLVLTPTIHKCGIFHPHFFGKCTSLRERVKKHTCVGEGVGLGKRNFKKFPQTLVWNFLVPLVVHC